MENGRYIKFLTYYGFAFSEDEFNELARRTRVFVREQGCDTEDNDDVSLIISVLRSPRKKGWLRLIGNTWNESGIEERLKKKFRLICVKTLWSVEDPGLEFKVEEELLEEAVKFLECLGYSNEEREDMKVVIPGIYFSEARRVLYDIQEMEKLSEQSTS